MALGNYYQPMKISMPIYKAAEEKQQTIPTRKLGSIWRSIVAHQDNRLLYEAMAQPRWLDHEAVLNKEAADEDKSRKPAVVPKANRSAAQRL
jgi:hypothetical protein